MHHHLLRLSDEAATLATEIKAAVGKMKAAKAEGDRAMYRREAVGEIMTLGTRSVLVPAGGAEERMQLAEWEVCSLHVLHSDTCAPALLGQGEGGKVRFYRHHFSPVWGWNPASYLIGSYLYLIPCII